jgi:hypothetical protein
MRRIAAVFVLVCGLSLPAEAVTLRDLVDFSRQGLSDDLLIALVEADKSVFHLSASDVKSLKDQGLSDRLLIHLLQTPSLRPEPEGRLFIADAPARPAARAPAPPHVTVIERVETVAVPVYVPVAAPRRVHSPDRGRDRDGDGRDRDEARRPSKPAPVEFWGYGGKQRPDSWQLPARRDGKRD